MLTEEEMAEFTKSFAMTARMIEFRDSVKRMFDDWPAVSAPYREMIAGAMEGSGDGNPLSAVLPLAADMKSRGFKPTVLLAVAVEMAAS